MNELILFVGHKIRDLRKAKGWTQENFAEKSGFQSSYIAGVERGERNITLDTLDRLLEVLEITPSMFFFTENIQLAKLKEHTEFLSTRSISEIELINQISKVVLEFNEKNKG
ncbi:MULTISPECIES: helix-turn-helix domain-containing protein [Bacillus]|uniref:helix-turn-helix domain-containing protein n=1 Tax=Bacillus TaxID=1386 RepID=UPI0005303036|nr:MULTISPECIES: helix-turn-helix transcriptional regulator [Bacillus]AIX08017.1 anaerobic benzoate catabolism transcriptional regulator [Bacillus subtilis]AOY07519.1 hypothetical protein BKN48_20280 [Bacillus subtilis]MCY7621942.1 helix-turn-helix domain-containing protein [Bacillus altitudinis]MCY7919305.1 helix-turn-helix domain-containing protein [Bacillus vallismortis]MCY7939606.1 helix-turn-helix domain-containing protein [Bacillus inaquosorum]